MKVCMCGSAIKWQVLPPDLARHAGADGFWKHTESNDIYCYPDDFSTMRNPALATPESSLTDALLAEVSRRAGTERGGLVMVGRRVVRDEQPPLLPRSEWSGERPMYGCPALCTEHRSHRIVTMSTTRDRLREPIVRPGEPRPSWMARYVDTEGEGE